MMLSDAFADTADPKSGLYCVKSEICDGQLPPLTSIMAAQPSRKRVVVETPVIPDRLYFKIGDVARICEVETYVLRFWETQFPQLKPNKSGTGQRLYRRRDVELALEIKRLVHTAGYTLNGARQALEQGQRKSGVQVGAAPGARDAAPKKDAAAALGRARAELREIAGMLASPVPHVPRKRSRVATIPASESLFPS